jgi:hypothetical protein
LCELELVCFVRSPISKKIVTMAKLRKGQPLRIVEGVYIRYHTGTFIEKCGKVSCRVKIDGDNVQERTLRLTSIEAYFSNCDNCKSTSTSKDTTRPDEATSKDEATRESLLREIRSLKLTMKALEKQIMSININEKILLVRLQNIRRSFVLSSRSLLF